MSESYQSGLTIRNWSKTLFPSSWSYFICILCLIIFANHILQIIYFLLNIYSQKEEFFFSSVGKNRPELLQSCPCIFLRYLLTCCLMRPCSLILNQCIKYVYMKWHKKNNLSLLKTLLPVLRKYNYTKFTRRSQNETAGCGLACVCSSHVYKLYKLAAVCSWHQQVSQH